VETFWIGRLRSAVIDGDVSHGSMMAGQSVGLVDHTQPVADILRELAEDTETELARVQKLLAGPAAS
jgi:enoyl-[acyl-carrier protein] reductase II